jgi:hypothetical protein
VFKSLAFPETIHSLVVMVGILLTHSQFAWVKAYGNFHYQFLIKQYIFESVNEFLLGMFFYYLK